MIHSRTNADLANANVKLHQGLSDSCAVNQDHTSICSLRVKLTDYLQVWLLVVKPRPTRAPLIPSRGLHIPFDSPASGLRYQYIH